MFINNFVLFIVLENPCVRLIRIVLKSKRFQTQYKGMFNREYENKEFNENRVIFHVYLNLFDSSFTNRVLICV